MNQVEDGIEPIDKNPRELTGHAKKVILFRLNFFPRKVTEEISARVIYSDLDVRKR